MKIPYKERVIESLVQLIQGFRTTNKDDVTENIRLRQMIALIDISIIHLFNLTLSQ